MRQLSELIILIKGGGEVASGVAHHLHRSHFRVCMTEIASPLAVCRGTTFSEAVFDKTKTIEGVTAELVAASAEKVHEVWQRQNIALAVDPDVTLRKQLKPDVFIDATIAKRNTGTRITDAPLVIGLGPGFYAGKDVHIVIETNSGANLGKIIREGAAEANTGIPVPVGGLTWERVLWAPHPGIFTSQHRIGDKVTAGDAIGWVESSVLTAPVSGMLRGLIRNSVEVKKGDKIIEVDPINDSAICGTIRGKMRVIAVSVLEAIKTTVNPET